MEGGGTVGRKKENEESEVRRLKLHRISITPIWCFGSTRKDTLDGVLCG